jgi:hypothetical protein
VLPALFRLNSRLRPEPDLVSAWPSPGDITHDPFSVRLRLRRARWSDGKPITAEDVRFTLGKLKAGPTGYRYRFLREVEVGGPRTLTLRFDRPVRRWWALFSLDDMVLPAHAYSDDWHDRPTVSGGPFAVREWTEGLRVRLVRNERYWGPKPVLAGIDVLFVPDDETRFQLLDRGELDAAFYEGEVNTGRRSRARGYVPTSSSLDGRKAAAWVWGPTWWELDMRSTLASGVARATEELADTALVAEILEDSGESMDGIPARFPVRRGPISGPWAGRGNPEEAKAALGGGGGSFDLGFANGTAGAIASMLYFRLRDLGVAVEPIGLDADAFERSLDDGSGAPAVIRIRRGADVPDAAAYASFSDEPGSGPVDDDIAGAETGDWSGTAGLNAAEWARAQTGLAQAPTAVPLARVRTWIVARAGLAGPRPLGDLSGPFWNAASWRLTLPH